MSFIKCGGSGELTETVLWTNSSPTSSVSNQTVTLSDDISNYDYIAVEYRISTSNSTSVKSIMSVEDYIASVGTTNTRLGFMVSISSTLYSRDVLYHSETIMGVSDCIKWGASGANNSYAIPINVYGLK